jgi:hypothetical protein
MSYLPRHEDFGPLASPAVHPKLNVPGKPGMLRRVFDAVMASRKRDVDRQIARFLAARSGGNLTDSLEREISQHLLTSGWSANSGSFHGRRFP